MSNVTGAIANIQAARVDVRNAALSGELPSHVADNTDIILAAVERGLMEHENGD